MTRHIALFCAACALFLAGCSDAFVSDSESSSVLSSNETCSSVDNTEDVNLGNSDEDTEKTEANEMKIVINGREFTAQFSDTKAAEDFRKMLPLTLEMSELNGNEKYFYLDESLSAKSESVGHINSGDVMLYGSSCVVLFYDSFDTSYTYTRIGRIENPEGLKAAVGSGNVTVEFK